MKVFLQISQRLKKTNGSSFKEYIKCWVTVNENKSTLRHMIGNFPKIGENKEPTRF